MRRYALIVAGGRGTRMGGELPKQFIPLAGKPILARTIENFYRYDPRLTLIVALPADQQEYWRRWCGENGFDIAHTVVEGGATRFHSVKNGLALVEPDSLVAIHDGVRPLVSHDVIERCFGVAESSGGAIPVLSLTESLRRTLPDGRSEAMNREEFVTVQTPQTFRAQEIRRAYELPYSEHFTDDASVYEAAGFAPTLVEGNRENLKITRPMDLAWAESLLAHD